MKQTTINEKGIVLEAVGGGNYRVQLTNGHQLLAQMCGKMKLAKIRVLPGDSVSIEISPYDLTRGRIVFRNKNIS